jgi:hypothetical protein
MSNMSYCRFQNTLGDLRDCESALDELLDTGGEHRVLSADELSAAKSLLSLCAKIVLRVSEDAEIKIDGDALDEIGEGHGKAWRAVESLLDGSNTEDEDAEAYFNPHPANGRCRNCGDLREQHAADGKCGDGEDYDDEQAAVAQEVR